MSPDTREGGFAGEPLACKGSLEIVEAEVGEGHGNAAGLLGQRLDHNLAFPARRFAKEIGEGPIEGLGSILGIGAADIKINDRRFVVDVDVGWLRWRKINSGQWFRQETSIRRKMQNRLAGLA